MTLRRAAIRLSTCALIVLAARSLAYVLAPRTAAALQLQHELGGPRVVVTAVVALTLGTLASVAIVWLAALGVRERHALDGAPGPTPAVDLGALAKHAAANAVLAAFGFAALESILHWRSGLGFHGLACLTGGVHRNALPILAALALVAAAAEAALAHVLAWMQRTLDAIARARGLGTTRTALVATDPQPLFPRPFAHGLGARGPPRLAVPSHPAA